MKHTYSLWDEMRRMQQQMDSLFETFFGSGPFFNPFFRRGKDLLEGPAGNSNGLVTSNYKQPLSDVYETDKELIAEVEMPGMDKKDIKVQVTDDGIEIKAESNAEIKHEDKKKGMYRLERNYSGFCRYFSLPDNVDAKKAKAEYKDGILKITVPKLNLEEHKKKLLEIK